MLSYAPTACELYPNAPAGVKGPQWNSRSPYSSWM